VNIAYTPNDTKYAVSTTIYYGLKPSVNSFSLTVEPPKTEVKTAPKNMLQENVTATQTSVKIPPQKTPQQIQQEAEDNGWLQVWWGPGDSWLTWLKLHVKLHIDWLGLTAHGWIDFPLGIGVEEFAGFTNVFIKIYEAVPDEAISIYQSAVINSITTTIAAFATGATATFLSQGTPWYLAALGIYSVGMMGAIGGIDAFVEKNLAKSILYGMGASLIGFVIGLYCLDVVTNWHRGLTMSSLPGTPTIVAATKATINYFISFGIKASAVLGFGMNFLNIPFSIVTACLGLLALSLAWLKG